MSHLINLSINLSKIDKSKIINGEKGKYLNLTISINDEKDNYHNDVSCWENQSKDERDNKTPKNYLGNGRVIWSSNNEVKTVEDDNNDDLPF